MEYFAVIDCGTTNSRIYLLNNDFEIINKGNEKVGVLDTAISGSKEKLKHGLKVLFSKIIGDAGLAVKDIKFAITSGMITSEIGLLEIPHLWAPVGISDLAKNLKIVQDPKIFPLDLPLIFIRGIKNYYSEEANYKDVRKMDFLRGEEAQIAGLLSLKPEIKLPTVVTVLSSHTKYIFINEEKKISGCLTTLSGQIYEAIKKEIPSLTMRYEVDPVRQGIADSWPNKMDDSCAREEWDWNPEYDLTSMTKDMLKNLRKKIK